MKKLIAIAAATFACFAACAQGTLVFANSWDGVLNAPDYLSDGKTKLSGPEFVAELMAGPSPTALASFGTTSFGTGSRAGYFFGGSLNIDSVGCGAIAFIQLNVWNTNAGVTFSAARASGMADAWGQTGIFPVRTSGGRCCDPPCVANPLEGLPSLSLNGAVQPPPLTLSMTSSNFVLVSWSAPPGAFGLEETLNLKPPEWGSLTNTPITAAENQVILVSPSGARFYRLVSRPTQFSYTSTNGAITITAYVGSGGAVTIPNTINSLPVTSIGEYAFYGSTSLTSVSIPDNVTNIADAAFESCSSLTNIAMGTGVRSIGQYAFTGCSGLTSTTIPDSVVGIGPWAFWLCAGLTNVTIGNNVDSIGFEAFNSCTSLANVLIGNRVATIGDYAFESCINLTNVTMGTNVNYIGVEAFEQCVSLSSITIPKSVTSIGTYGFLGCTNLLSVFFNGDAPTTGSLVFLGSDNVTVYYLPGTIGWGTTLAGRAALLWNPLAQHAAIQNGQFGFDIVGTANIPVLVQGSTNPASGNWTALQAGTLANGVSHFIDSDWKQYPVRFYRITH